MTMRTHELIGLLSRDAPRPRSLWQRPDVLIAAGAIASLGLFGILLDIRVDLFAASGLSATMGKWLPAALLVGLGGAMALRLRQPEASASFVSLIVGLLSVAAVTLGADIVVNGLDDLAARARGSSAAACLVTIGLLSLPILTAMIYILRQGAVTAPGEAGLAAGLAAAGFAAAVYALHCNEDSPFFVASWYGLAVAVMGGVGWLAGRLALRW